MAFNLPNSSHGKAIFACALGDTLGLPFEYSSSKFVRDHGLHQSETQITWSDDTQQSLILLDEYLRYGNLDPRRFMERLVQFKNHPKDSQRGFGLHRGTGRGFRHAVLEFEKSGEFSPMPGRDGNGASMRIPSVAYSMEMTENTLNQLLAVSSTTHATTNSFHTVEAITRVIWQIRRGSKNIDALEGVVEELPLGEVRSVLTKLISSDDWIETITENKPELGPGDGYSLRSPVSAIYIALTSSSMQEVIERSLEIGGDTDTTAAIAASIASGIHDLAELDGELLDFRGAKYLLLWDGIVAPEPPTKLDEIEAHLTNGGS